MHTTHTHANVNSIAIWPCNAVPRAIPCATPVTAPAPASAYMYSWDFEVQPPKRTSNKRPHMRKLYDANDTNNAMVILAKLAACDDAVLDRIRAIMLHSYETRPGNYHKCDYIFRKGPKKGTICDIKCKSIAYIKGIRHYCCHNHLPERVTRRQY